MSGTWVVVGIDVGSAYWPNAEMEVTYRGRTIRLRPPSETNAPTAVLRTEGGETFDDGLLFIRRFLSAFCWAVGDPIDEIMATGGSHPFAIGWSGRRPHDGTPKFRLDYLPEPTNPKAVLALAFYREAVGLDNLPYRFLGFAKILNVLFPTGSEQVAWINNAIDDLEDFQAQKRASELRAGGEDVGSYLYASGRCAVAHAYAEPLVDPERTDDTKRLSKDLPLVRALAEHLIEHEFGVKSWRTVWKEHLYELQGLRELLGEELTSKLKEGGSVPPSELPSLPRLSFRVRWLGSLPAFEGLVPTILEADRGRLLVKCQSQVPGMVVEAGFNLRAERLEFDPERSVIIGDDGSVGAVEAAIQEVRFVRALLCNGQLEVWDADKGTLLGRSDPYMPVNIDMHGTLKNLDQTTSKLEELRVQREASRAAGASEENRSDD